MIKVVQMWPDEWAKMGENFHRAVFDELRPAYMNRIDYALIFDVDGAAIGYGTVRELDHETAYLQYGGKVDSTNAHLAVEGVSVCMEWLLARYKRVSCLVHNENVKFLKIALHVGLRAIGCRTFENQIFLEMFKEREK